MKDDVGMNKEAQKGQPQGAVDPKLQKQVDSYVSGLSKIIHGKDTRAEVMEMLKVGGPEKSIPDTALKINGQMEGAIKSKGQSPNLDVLFQAVQFLVGDLIDVGNAAGIFEVSDDAQVQEVLGGTMQMYIEKGIKDGTIDVVELQEKAEAMMPDDMREELTANGAAGGLPQRPDQDTAMNAYGEQQYKKGMLKGGGEK